MDDEHKECTDSFNKVIEDPTPDNFQLLFNILKSHFDHEEELMKTYSEDNEERKTSSSSFSAIDSHKMDHQRMLKIAETELERVIGCGTK
jgi:hemerythrin